MPDQGGADVVEHAVCRSGRPGSGFNLASASTRRPAPLARTTKTLTLPGYFRGYTQPTPRKIKFRAFEIFIDYRVPSFVGATMAAEPVMETLPQMWVRQPIQENLCEDLMDSIKLEGMEEESDDAGDDVDDPSDPAESSDEETLVCIKSISKI